MTEISSNLFQAVVVHDQYISVAQFLIFSAYHIFQNDPEVRQLFHVHPYFLLLHKGFFHQELVILNLSTDANDHQESVLKALVLLDRSHDEI